MSSTYQIEAATLRDLNGLRQLEKECFGQDAWSLWDLIATLSFANILRLKAIVDGNLIGFVAGEIKTAEDLGWITTLGVLPAYRQKGIGKALLLTCEEQMGLSRVRLSVARSNLVAIQLYYAVGYHQIGIWPRYYVSGEDALVLEKERLTQDR